MKEFRLVAVNIIPITLQRVVTGHPASGSSWSNPWSSEILSEKTLERFSKLLAETTVKTRIIGPCAGTLELPLLIRSEFFSFFFTRLGGSS